MIPGHSTDPTPPDERSSSREVDERLIEGLRINDEGSLAAVYDSYASLAYGLALRVLRAPPDAEDVVQDSFLALWKQAERLDASRGIRSYLMTIVHHKAIDKLRQKGRHRETDLEGPAAELASSDDPATEAVRTTERETIVEAMKSLPAEQQQTLQLAYFNGLTLNEVARHMQVPQGTVKSRLRLALGHLRKQLVNQI